MKKSFNFTENISYLGFGIALIIETARIFITGSVDKLFIIYILLGFILGRLIGYIFDKIIEKNN